MGGMDWYAYDARVEAMEWGSERKNARRGRHDGPYRNQMQRPNQREARSYQSSTWCIGVPTNAKALKVNLVPTNGKVLGSSLPERFLVLLRTFSCLNIDERKARKHALAKFDSNPRA